MGGLVRDSNPGPLTPTRECCSYHADKPHPQWKMVIMSSLFDKGMKTWTSPMVKALTGLAENQVKTWLCNQKIKRNKRDVDPTQHCYVSTGQRHCETEGTSRSSLPRCQPVSVRSGLCHRSIIIMYLPVPVHCL